MAKTKFKNMSEDEIDELYAQLDEEKEIEATHPEDADVYEYSSDMLLKEINDLPNGEERSRAIKDLEVMQRITNERNKLRSENRKISHECEIREKELALREEEVTNMKKNNVLNSIVSIGGTIVSFVCYGVLLGRQNRFESGETYTTNGSRNLLSNISRIVKR